MVSKNYYGEENNMNNLLNKLVNTEGGIWVFNGVNNEYYKYVLQFSNYNKITFSYKINSDNGYGVYNINILRNGTFIIENNKVIINFFTVIGKKYNKPNFWDEPLIEKKTIILEINGIIEHKILVKQINRENIFENHNENTELEFIAEKPIID